MGGGGVWGTGLPTSGLRPTERPPSSQAYVNEFKFRSILADDLLEFYLEYFPELKQRKVDAIPGERAARGRRGCLTIWPSCLLSVQRTLHLLTQQVALGSRPGPGPRLLAPPSSFSWNLDRWLTPWAGPAPSGAGVGAGVAAALPQQSRDCLVQGGRAQGCLRERRPPHHRGCWTPPPAPPHPALSLPVVGLGRQHP